MTPDHGSAIIGAMTPKQALFIDAAIASLRRWADPSVHPGHVLNGTADRRARSIGRYLYQMSRSIATTSVSQDGREFYRDEDGALLYRANRPVPDGDVCAAQHARDEFCSWARRTRFAYAFSRPSA